MLQLKNVYLLIKRQNIFQRHGGQWIYENPRENGNDSIKDIEEINRAKSYSMEKSKSATQIQYETKQSEVLERVCI